MYTYIYYILYCITSCIYIYICIIVPCVSFHGSPQKTGGKQRPRTDGEAPETLEAGPWGIDGLWENRG